MEIGQTGHLGGMLEAVMQLADRFIAYLRSRRNLVGGALALVGAGLAIADPAGPVAAVVLVAGFYALGAAAVRPSPAISRFGFEPKQVLKVLQDEIVAVSGRVPPDIIVRIQRIELIIRTQIIPRLDVLPPGSLDLYLIERTASDYLPRAVEHYLRLPADYTASPDATRSPSAHDVLIAELAVLENGMKRVAEVVHRSDMDRLLAHHRFISDRFRRVDASD
jgi:hypothetical protein